MKRQSGFKIMTVSYTHLLFGIIALLLYGRGERQ